MRRLPVLIPQSGRVEARTRASNDADVSSTLPIIPYGGFSPIRLEGWHVGQAPSHTLAACSSRHTPTDVWFVSAFRARRSGLSDPALCRVEHWIVRRLGGGVVLRPRGPRSCPSYAVSNRHHLIDPIRPTREHITISPHSGLYAMPSLCGSA